MGNSKEKNGGGGIEKFIGSLKIMLLRVTWREN